jgi:hypothetical protein
MGVKMNVIVWFQTHWTEIVSVITSIIGVASIIVKLTPTLKDDNILLGIIKFLGKYVALDRTVNDNAVRASTTTQPK